MSLTYHQRRSLARRANGLARQWDRESAEAATQAASDRAARIAERDRRQAAEDDAAHRDIGALAAGDLVRDRHGWHRVVRISKATVTVATPHTWTERIPLDRIIETRRAA